MLQDQAVVYLMMLRAGRIYVSNAVLYNYLQHPGSITNSIYNSIKKYTSLFAIWQERLPIFRQYCPENVHYQMIQLADLSMKGLIFIRPDSESKQLRNDMKGFLQANKAYLLHKCEKKNVRAKLYIFFYCRPFLHIILHLKVRLRMLKRYFNNNLSYYG